MANDDYSRDPDALYDDTVVARLQVVCRRDGSLAVAGDINMPLSYLLQCLEEAKAAVRRHHSRMDGRSSPVLIPGVDAPPLPALLRR